MHTIDTFSFSDTFIYFQRRQGLEGGVELSARPYHQLVLDPDTLVMPQRIPHISSDDTI